MFYSFAIMHSQLAPAVRTQFIAPGIVPLEPVF
jgi:hypothetical protein